MTDSISTLFKLSPLSIRRPVAEGGKSTTCCGQIIHHCILQKSLTFVSPAVRAKDQLNKSHGH
eukprot:5454152-Amphidinium_carterae.1